MRVLLLCLLNLSLCAESRIDLHKKASETFLNWNFFENGRGMTVSPNLTRYLWMVQKENKISQKSINGFIEQRYGFVVNEKNKLMGVFNIPWKGMDVGVLGCTGCHSGKAAGHIIAGLGNKTIDPYMIGKDTYRIQRVWGLGKTDPNYKYIHSKAMNFAKVISDPNLANLAKGVVSDSTIKTFFYKDIGIPYPKDMGRAQVKVPHLWGIKQKRPAGVFNDGSLSGEDYGWIFGAELFASDSAEHLRASLPKIEWLTDEVLGNLLPPKYPFEIDEQLVKTGELLFQKNCFSCHGPHQRDFEGQPIYTEPKVIPIHVVQTDRDKLNAINEDFIEVVEKSSLGDILKFEQENVGKGYFAPKLWGIWARFPYMHNASVPTLYHMLVKPQERPKIFSMKDAGEEYRFNRAFGGLTLFSDSEKPRALRRAKRGARDIYYVKREGLSNIGHYFPRRFDKLTHTDRLALVEYLKALY